VVVNCTRVLAKLSISDACRQQINRQDQNIQNLVDLVLREARAGSSGECEWPGQHTWTILTRVCFTLGNLTTSNERNRYVHILFYFINDVIEFLLDVRHCLIFLAILANVNLIDSLILLVFHLLMCTEP